MYYNTTKEKLILAFQNTTIVKQVETHVKEIKTKDIQENIPVEGQEDEVVVKPPPPITVDKFYKYANTFTEGLSEDILEYMILDGTQWTVGNINSNKTGYMGQVTKNIRRYVREMKSKDNKELEAMLAMPR